jgi:hypothetical protein
MERKGLYREVSLMIGGLHNEELHNTHSSANIITKMKPMSIRWVGHVIRIGKTNACRGLSGKTRRKETIKIN